MARTRGRTARVADRPDEQTTTKVSGHERLCAAMFNTQVRDYVERLITIIGPDYSYQTEEEFCRSSGCPHRMLERWLRTEWAQHDINKVFRLEDKPGFFPLILINVDPDAPGPWWCILRMFCVKPGAGTPPAPTRQWSN